MITLQYLEPGPHIAEITPRMAGEKLRAALDILPVDAILLGWNLPAPLVDACREETVRRGVKLYRWQPLLAGDGVLFPREAWQTRNLSGQCIPGYRGFPEFTFVCPNHPEVRETALARLETLAAAGVYDGIFLDRMRFPSPSGGFAADLGCFCPHCQRVAAEESDLDLDAVRAYVAAAPGLTLFRAALNPAEMSLFARFLDFRQKSVTRLVGEAVQVIRAAGLEVGLDLFPPLLTRMVGQDLGALPLLADWTKLMIYTHAFGPAALPYEMIQFVTSLAAESEFGADAPDHLVPLTEEAADVARSMLSLLLGAEPLSQQYISARQGAPHDATLLAGIELVEIPGVCELTPDGILHDLNVLLETGVDGLALSWDLWRIPLERLELVREVLSRG